MTFIGPYEITNPFFAAGGQSRVLEAIRDGKPYAIKLMAADPGDAEALARFDLEAEILRTIDHPNIVRCIDDGIDGHFRYIAMPRPPGRNLRFELADRKRIDPLSVVEIARQLTLALQVFHQLGAVYRDLKPENVQIDSESTHVWLLDAGFARYVKRTRITRPDGSVPGPRATEPRKHLVARITSRATSSRLA